MQDLFKGKEEKTIKNSNVYPTGTKIFDKWRRE